MASGSPQIRVLELFSGLGGMHWALKEADVNFTVMAAMDINEAAGKGEKKDLSSLTNHAYSNTASNHFQCIVTTFLLCLMCHPTSAA